MSSQSRKTTRSRRSHSRRNGEGIAVKRAVMNGAGKIKTAVADATDDVLESLHGVRTHATAQARENLENLRDTAAGYVNDGRSQAEEAKALVEQKIRSQPVTSVLLAAGVGFLIGAF